MQALLFVTSKSAFFQLYSDLSILSCGMGLQFSSFEQSCHWVGWEWVGQRVVHVSLDRVWGWGQGEKAVLPKPVAEALEGALSYPLTPGLLQPALPCPPYPEGH